MPRPASRQAEERTGASKHLCARAPGHANGEVAAACSLPRAPSTQSAACESEWPRRCLVEKQCYWCGFSDRPKPSARCSAVCRRGSSRERPNEILHRRCPPHLGNQSWARGGEVPGARPHPCALPFLLQSWPPARATENLVDISQTQGNLLDVAVVPCATETSPL